MEIRKFLSENSLILPTHCGSGGGCRGRNTEPTYLPSLRSFPFSRFICPRTALSLRCDRQTQHIHFSSMITCSEAESVNLVQRAATRAHTDTHTLSRPRRPTAVVELAHARLVRRQNFRSHCLANACATKNFSNFFESLVITESNTMQIMRGAANAMRYQCHSLP